MNRLAIIKQAINDQPAKKIQVEKKEEVATIWLNSPKDLNALSKEFLAKITDALDQLNKDKSIKVIVLRSRLEKFFCAGANIKQFVKSGDITEYPETMQFRKVETRFRQHHKPVVAVVQGIALGGGFELALLCDIILCSDKAQFGLPQITLGIMPGFGGTQILPRIVGEKVAKRMILTGLPIDAKEAHRLNIAQLLPTQNFEQAVAQIVNTIASKSINSLIGANRSIKATLETTLEQGLDFEAVIFSTLFTKKGAKEGISAFIEKRKPNFKGI